MLKRVTRGTMGGKSVWYWTTTAGGHKGTRAVGHSGRGAVELRAICSGGGTGGWAGGGPLGARRFFGLAGLGLLAAEWVGLAMLFTSDLVQPLAELVVLSFHLGQAADQTMVLALEGLVLLVQHGQAPAEMQKLPITFLA